MSSLLVSHITSEDPGKRNRAIEDLCRPLDAAGLLREADALEQYRRREQNLYRRVRALLFLFSIHRYELPARREYPLQGMIPYDGFRYQLERRFEDALGCFRKARTRQGDNAALSSAMAASYHGLGFQTLADQVRQTVRSTPGNTWMFRTGHPGDHPLRLRREMRHRAKDTAPYPILCEQTAVRMDLTHCAWSDIFFLGMDYPEGARVLNVSIDLGVHGRDPAPRPPIEAYLRVIDEPVLRLTSVDLESTADLQTIDDVFDFGRDYLGLLKAALIASGLVPAGCERSGLGLPQLLETVIGPGLGLELISNVNRIPKGSRLAVSTNLLGALISVCMRATGQTLNLSGPLSEEERRIVAARAILGEWLGGSGGGWQDSGGLWPGIKLIEGVEACNGDSEHGISRGCLLPRHTHLGEETVGAEARERLQDSLVLVHGGMAQNVGPILEMVTEKYLLRHAAAWAGRQDALGNLGKVLAALSGGDLPRLGQLLTENFFGPLQTIIPWVSNLYTESLIHDAKSIFKDDFWGFWMLGGMSGGGMGFMFQPSRREEAQDRMQEIMITHKRKLEAALPFAMDPVVYDFSINDRGSWAEFLQEESAILPPGYYETCLPHIVRRDPRTLGLTRRLDLETYGTACRKDTRFAGSIGPFFQKLLPGQGGTARQDHSLEDLLLANGFDAEGHEQIRADLRAGRIGLAKNRLPTTTQVEDVPSDHLFQPGDADSSLAREGEALLRSGAVAVVTLAAGVGSRWTQGAGVVKALHPFYKFAGRHRSFLDVHLAKTRRVASSCQTRIPHIITTSHLTHGPIEATMSRLYGSEMGKTVFLSPGRSIGLRMVPMTRDLVFAWQETAQQKLDEQKEKVRESGRNALLSWARSSGEGSDYRDNLPFQCLHPVGHWYEIPNLLKNGVLANLLSLYPNLRYLMIHNIDTLGADLDPVLLGWHARSGQPLAFEVIAKRLEDHGGGLARIDGRPRLVEGMALPREEDEFHLSYYNTNTSWICLDGMLGLFGLERNQLEDSRAVNEAVRRMARRLPTYVTLKEVKKRWGHGQEDVYPVAQFEKLWGDMTAITPEPSGFALVPRLRGQQLKDQAQLDGWLWEGSASDINELCLWT